MSDIIAQAVEHAQLDSRYGQNEDDELAARLARLRGQDPATVQRGEERVRENGGKGNGG